MSKGRRVAALDTCALSFYQQGSVEGAPPDAVRCAKKIEHYMRGVQDEKGEVFLPAICLGEYLAQYSDHQRESVRDGIEENFIIIEYGVEAAMQFAKMRFDKEAFNAAKNKSGRTAQTLKVDCLITALACGYGATEILTDNSRDFVNLTRNRLTVMLIDDLPDPPKEPGGLFDGVQLPD
ncbi:MAG: hypothetical protein ABGY75_03345 [Gemmataceae bacterium]